MDKFKIGTSKFNLHRFAKKVIKQFPKKKFRFGQSNYTIAYNTDLEYYVVVKHEIYMINGARYVSEEDVDRACEIINTKMEEMKDVE